MATKALRGTPRALYTYRTKPSSLSARRMLPRSAIASTRCASTFLSQKYPSKGGKLLDSLSAVTFAVCFFYAPLHGQNLQCAGPDDDAVAQFQKANSEAVAVFNEICKVIRLQPNEKIEVLPNEGAFVVRLESDAGQSDVVIPYTDFVNPDLPAGQPTLLAIWLEVPDGIDDFPTSSSPCCQQYSNARTIAVSLQSLATQQR